MLSTFCYQHKAKCVCLHDCDAVSFGIVKQSLYYCSTIRSQNIESRRSLTRAVQFNLESPFGLCSFMQLLYYKQFTIFEQFESNKLKKFVIVTMVWMSWMRLCIGFLVITIGCIGELDAVSLNRFHTINKDNVRKCGYEVDLRNFSDIFWPSNKLSIEQQKFGNTKQKL